MRKQITRITIKGGEILEVSTELGNKVRQSVARDTSGFVILSELNNRMIQKYSIMDINDVWVTDKLQGEPINTPSHLIGSSDGGQPDFNGEGYRKFQEMKKRLLSRKLK